MAQSVKWTYRDALTSNSWITKSNWDSWLFIENFHGLSTIHSHYQIKLDICVAMWNLRNLLEDFQPRYIYDAIRHAARTMYRCILIGSSSQKSIKLVWALISTNSLICISLNPWISSQMPRTSAPTTFHCVRYIYDMHWKYAISRYTHIFGANDKMCLCVRI